GSDYDSQDPPAYFYNHFACSFARYTENACGSAMAIFNQSHGLGAVSSTKTGGMLDFEYFYQPLGQGGNLGQALKSWFEYEIAGGVDSYDISWFYGMTLMGDPFLKPVNTGCYLDVQFPENGELFTEADTANIKWLRFGTDTVSRFVLSYSTDGGATFPGTLATDISGSLVNYQWMGPALNSTRVKLKIEAYDNFDSLLGEARSESVFTVDSKAPDPCLPIYPGYNSVIGSYSPCFAWAPAFDACGVKEYRVQCAADEEFYFMDFDTTVSDTVFSAELHLEDNYFWRVRAADLAGHIGDWSATSVFTVNPAGIEEEKPGETGAPVGFRASNYPNPAGPKVSFAYRLPAAAGVVLEIFDISGRQVAREDLGPKQAGDHSYSWRAGQSTTGVYFYRITAGKHRKTGRLVLVK
ncbi:MAG: T9SS type A sorting domain-containing protein, partial [Deltaproteobacteria bacterium]|nr:T9SS type A sorting domain-containing protein [Deltaproteobacteria bacterium]